MTTSWRLGANMDKDKTTTTIPADETDDCVHVHLKFGTTTLKPTPFPMTIEQRVTAFHSALKLADPDWPFALAAYDVNENKEFVANDKCSVCGGIVYMNPHISPPEIIALSQQFGLLIEKMRYLREQDCHVISDIRFNNSNQQPAVKVDAEKTEAQLIEEVLTIPYAEATQEKPPAKEVSLYKPETSSFGFQATMGRGNSTPPSWEEVLETPSWENSTDKRFLN